MSLTCGWDQRVRIASPISLKWDGVSLLGLRSEISLFLETFSVNFMFDVSGWASPNTARRQMRFTIVRTLGTFLFSAYGLLSFQLGTG